MRENPTPPVPATVPVRLNAADRSAVEMIAEAFPDARGLPFITAELACRLGLSFARRIIERGEVHLYRPLLART